jgi:hypothetical protein
VDEDDLLDPDTEDLDGVDGSEVPVKAAIAMVVNGTCPEGVSTTADGGLTMDGEAENRAAEADVDDVVLNVDAVVREPGKRKIIANSLYSNEAVFWRH